MGSGQPSIYGLFTIILLVITIFGTMAAASFDTHGQVRAHPDTPGTMSTHTISVSTDDTMSGEWQYIEITYGSDHALTRATIDDLKRFGIDRGGDNAYAHTDITLLNTIESVTIEDGRTLTIHLTEQVNIERGDEVFLMVRNVTNPPSRTVAPVWVYLRSPDRDTQSVVLPLEIGPDDPFISINNLSAYDLAYSDGLAVEDVTPTVYAPNGGFVVATVMRNGQTVGQVGHSDYVPPGAHAFIRISVNATVQEDDRLVVTLYADTNNNTRFDASDQPYRQNGTPVSASAGIRIHHDVHRDTTTTITTTKTTSTTTSHSTVDSSRSASTTTLSETTHRSTPGFEVLSSLAVIAVTVLLFLRRPDI